MRAAPAVSCAKQVEKDAHEHTGSAENIRHSLRNGFTAYIALTPEYRVLLASVASRKLARRLRRRVHTTLPYASTPLVSTFSDYSRSLSRPATLRAHDAAASTAFPSQ